MHLISFIEVFCPLAQQATEFITGSLLDLCYRTPSLLTGLQKAASSRLRHAFMHPRVLLHPSKSPLCL
jgi:hypothetical protein